MARLAVRHGSTANTDSIAAVQEIRAAIEQPNMRVVLLFCSPSYDLDVLGPALRGNFSCPVVACTSSGQIGRGGYQRGGMSATSLASDLLSVTPHLVAPLTECWARASAVGDEVRAARDRAPQGTNAFGLLLVDGLSLAEEALAAALYQSLGQIPLIGGSAGDDLTFSRTAVYWQGEFLSNAAVLTVFETKLPVATMKLHHFRPTSRQLVTTRADLEHRRVIEINGVAAVEAYAAVLGLRPDQLGADVFSKHPLMLRLGRDHYVRGIQRVNPDGSMTFFCAIDEGLVLTVGEEDEPLATLEAGLASATAGSTAGGLVIGCDSILRRLGFERAGTDVTVGNIMAEYNVVGFSTYGEQFNAVHVNQTFTGIVIGG